MVPRAPEINVPEKCLVVRVAVSHLRSSLPNSCIFRKLEKAVAVSGMFSRAPEEHSREFRENTGTIFPYREML